MTCLVTQGSFRLKPIHVILPRIFTAIGAASLISNAYATDPAPNCSQTTHIGNYDPLPVALPDGTSLIQSRTIQGTNVSLTIKLSNLYGGIGVGFELNGVNVLETRAATGAGWQTSTQIGEIDTEFGREKGVHVFNQAAGNSDVGQWGYPIAYTSPTDLTSAQSSPLMTDAYVLWDYSKPNPPTVKSKTNQSPCTSSSVMFDRGRQEISMGLGATSGHGNGILVTNQYTYLHQTQPSAPPPQTQPQPWTRWVAEQAFYLNKSVANKNNNNLRIYLAYDDGRKIPINPFTDLAFDPNHPYQSRNEFFDLKYAVLVWNISGQDIGVAIDARGTVPACLGSPEPNCRTNQGVSEITKFHGSLERQDNNFGVLPDPNDNKKTVACMAGTDYCGVFAWHTYMRELANVTFTPGTSTSVATNYRIGTLQQLADWGYTTPIPVCSSVGLTPASLPSTGGSVSAQANCSGAGLTYAWTVNGVAYGGNSSAISATLGQNTSGTTQNYSVCVTASNASGSSQKCGTFTQAAPVVSGPVPLVRAESNNALWSANNLIDANYYSTYSSNVFPSSVNSSYTYVAAWMGGPNSIKTIRLYARNSNGMMLAFPAAYNIYMTDSANTQLVYMGNFTQQPNANGVATINLSSPFTTWGIQVVPTAFGTDNYGNYFFQLNEIELVP